MIYLVEDDENIQNFVVYALNQSGFTARGFSLPSDFWAAVKKELPQLLLLDVMLPEQDGLEILRAWRQKNETRQIPVIMLTAKSTEYDKVLGLDSGADDYITKPFGTMELVSRIKAVLRRAGQEAPQEEYHIGSLYVCPSRHIVTVGGAPVALTLKEYKLLCYLLQNKGAVASREQILQEVWGYAFDGENRTVDVHIRTLRVKLGECGRLIETIKGIGYKIGETV